MIDYVLLSSRTRFGELRSVFGSGHSDLLAHIAQVSVLYEDLRIETYAIIAKSMPATLEVLGENYRVNYFLRRSIATILEFSGALNEVNRCHEFKTFKNGGGLGAAMLKRWEGNIQFFNSHHELFKKVRNDIGGHFGIEAARYAVANLRSGINQKIRTTFDRFGRGGGVELHFAGEIAGTAMTRGLPGKGSQDQEIEFLIQTVSEAYGCATSSVHILVAACLWDRFGH